jgi:hypothetical protein
MLRGVSTKRGARVSALAIIVLITGGWQVPAIPATSKLPSAQEIDSILKELSDVTGFRIRKHLPFALITRAEVNEYVKEQIKESIKPDEIRAEEVTLKKFGFAPSDFDLKKTTIDLLTEQAAAFYDFKKKKLFISDWATVNMRDVALVHELAHALADQNFPIKKFLNKAGDDSEESLARQAVVEGQASWLMLQVAALRAGKTLADERTAREVLNHDVDAPDSDYPVYNNAPLYLRRTLTFPYTDGGRFQEAVFLHEGKLGFARVFREPPESSAQIMHPERYFQKIRLASPDLPKPVKHAKPFVTGEMGELETRILIEQYAGAGLADQLGPKIRGASYRIDESKPARTGDSKPGPRMTLVYASEWRDDQAASQFFDAYQKILRGKWKHIDVVKQSADRFSGKSEDGYFAVTRNGKLVLSEEGFSQATLTY